MDSDKPRHETFTFVWGDEVQVKPTAPLEFHPGEYGAVCGMSRFVEGDEFLVEFASGEAINIPEAELMMIEATKDDQGYRRIQQDGVSN